MCFLFPQFFAFSLVEWLLKLIPFISALLSISGSSYVYPCDLIPFTRRPLFLIIDSFNSHAFKAGLMVIFPLLVKSWHYSFFTFVQLQTVKEVLRKIGLATI
jgi:Protein SCAI